MLGFRVWDTVLKKKITEWNQSAISMSGNIVYPDGYGIFNPNERYIGMQSTGLRDMHQEKEIYEGDILWHGANKDLFLVQSVYQFFKEKFSDGGKIQFDEIGIIGNRFENPELLERVK